MRGLTKEHNWQNATIMASASAAAYKNLGGFQKQFDLHKPWVFGTSFPTDKNGFPKRVVCVLGVCIV